MLNHICLNIIQYEILIAFYDTLYLSIVFARKSVLVYTYSVDEEIAIHTETKERSRCRQRQQNTQCPEYALAVASQDAWEYCHT
jgi:hypothetical protein